MGARRCISRSCVQNVSTGAVWEREKVPDKTKAPADRGLSCGRYRARTDDLFRVKEPDASKNGLDSPENRGYGTASRS